MYIPNNPFNINDTILLYKWDIKYKGCYDSISFPNNLDYSSKFMLTHQIYNPIEFTITMVENKFIRMDIDEDTFYITFEMFDN